MFPINHKYSLVGPGITISVGILFIVLGLIGYFVIHGVVKTKIRQIMVVDSPNSPGYACFMNYTCTQDETNAQYVFTFYNLTNPYEFAAGTALPNFQSVGPFTYIPPTIKSEATFPNEGGQIRYKGSGIYNYVPSKEYPLDTDILLYTVNLFYVAAVSRLGSEETLNIMMAAGVLDMLKLFIFKNAFTTKATCLIPIGNINGIICTLKAYLQKHSYPENYSEAVGTNMLNFFSNATYIKSYLDAYKTASTGGSDVAIKTIFNGWNATYTLANADHINGYLFQFQKDSRVFFLKDATPLGLAFQKVSVREYLFVENKLLKMLQYPGMRMFTNETELGIFGYYTSYTGKMSDGDTNGQRYSEYENLTEIVVYPKKFPMNFRVAGIPSFLNQIPDTADFYYSLIQRTIPTNKASTSTVHGIPVQIYIGDSKKLASVDPEYGNMIAGFFSLIPVKDAPIFLTVPYYGNVDKKYTSMITGITAPPGYDTDSRLSIEPVTGMAIDVKLQILLTVKIDFMTKTYADMKNNSAYTADMFYPVLMMVQQGTITDSSAGSLKMVATAMRAATIILGVLCGLGSFTTVIGVAILGYVMYMRSRVVAISKKDDLIITNISTTNE